MIQTSATIRRIGHSQGVIIPADVLAELGAGEGDEISLLIEREPRYEWLCVSADQTPRAEPRDSLLRALDDIAEQSDRIELLCDGRQVWSESSDVELGRANLICGIKKGCWSEFDDLFWWVFRDLPVWIIRELGIAGKIQIHHELLRAELTVREKTALRRILKSCWTEGASIEEMNFSPPQ